MLGGNILRLLKTARVGRNALNLKYNRNKTPERDGLDMKYEALR